MINKYKVERELIWKGTEIWNLKSQPQWHIFFPKGQTSLFLQNSSTKWETNFQICETMGDILIQNIAVTNAGSHTTLWLYQNKNSVEERSCCFQIYTPNIPLCLLKLIYDYLFEYVYMRKSNLMKCLTTACLQF